MRVAISVFTVVISMLLTKLAFWLPSSIVAVFGLMLLMGSRGLFAHAQANTFEPVGPYKDRSTQLSQMLPRTRLQFFADPSNPERRFLVLGDRGTVHVSKPVLDLELPSALEFIKSELHFSGWVRYALPLLRALLGGLYPVLILFWFGSALTWVQAAAVATALYFLVVATDRLAWSLYLHLTRPYDRRLDPASRIHLLKALRAELKTLSSSPEDVGVAYIFLSLRAERLENM